jgi:ABC-type uncharacterized transport system ATPase subunit
MKIEIRNVYKHFGKIQANDDISLSIEALTIQGILGENGAGKSTLMKILSGFIQADSGEILINGKKIVIHTPADAIHYGIGMLHQDPLDFPPLRVIDNIMLGFERKFFPNRKKAIKGFEEIQKSLDFHISPKSFVEELTVGERQQLEIVRLLMLGVKVLILDEPTTGISAIQRDKLFSAVRKLASDGLIVLFVSHKLEEVEDLCHTVAVFRQGRMVGQAVPPYRTDELVKMMFGKLVKQSEKVCLSRDRILLEVKNLEIDDIRLKIHDVNFCVHGGEVIGLAGMEGSGQSLVLRSIAGLLRPSGGGIRLRQDGHFSRNLVGRNYLQYKKAGIAYLPAARLEDGLIPGLKLSDHFVLSEKQERFFIDNKRYRQITENRIKEFNIRGSHDSPIEALSGGNQQRTLLALLRDPLELLLLEHPTRGLDIESGIYIWSKLKARCAKGSGIIFISSDLDEILLYSDSVMVFFNGRVSKSYKADSLSFEDLGQMIGGRGWQ